MGRKKKPVPDDPEQYAQFVETAERIQDENAGERFEEAMKHIASSTKKRPSKNQNDDGSGNVKKSSTNT